MTRIVRPSIFAILLLLTIPAAVVLAQTGIETTLWTWTPPAIHHNAVVKVETESGSGTGVLVHVFKTRPVANGFEGICLTAEHVVDPKDKRIKVSYQNGKRAKNCKVLSKNKALDVALLWVWVPKDINPVTIANSSLIIGETLEFCGLGGDSSLSQMRHFKSIAESPTTSDQIFASAPLLPGDSGGPVFNIDGELVGIISGGWFWYDGGVKSQSGKSVNVTWPARACHLDPINELLQNAIAKSTALAKN